MKIHAILLGIIGGLLMIAGCATVKEGGVPQNLYKTLEGQKIVYESYDKTMALWSAAFEDDWVETDYGRTHVVISGPANGKPLFLIPGLFADATMWYANASALAGQYRVFALDMVNYGGKSEPSGKTITDARDYGAWFQGVMNHYGYSQVAVAGLSYGSWTSLSIAREIPNSISAMVLIDPSESFMPMDGGIAWKGFWSFVFFPNRAKHAAFFDWIGGGYTDPQMQVWFEHLLDVIQFGTTNMNRLPQKLYKPEELTMVRMPVLILAGGKPILYKDPAKFAAAAMKSLPQAIIEIVPDTGHGLNMEKPDYVNQLMLSFLAEK